MSCQPGLSKPSTFSVPTLVLFVVFTMFFLFPVKAQQRVIIDTDIDSDVDDVGAMAMLYNLHNRSIIQLLGVIVTSDDPYAPTCVAALNTYYGFPSLPIGFLEGQQQLTNHSRYTKQLSEGFPHRMASYKDAEQATRLYRRLLSESPDSSVTIVTIGHLSSLQKLLLSPPDDISTASGKLLVERKVQKWYCMGGQFPAGKEANFYRPDSASTVYCLEQWTKPVVFCGWETGKKVITGGQYLQSKLKEQHPVYRAYSLYNNFKGRPSWDQLAIYLLTGSVDGYFRLENRGRCMVEADGSNKWIVGERSNHSYLVFKEEANIAALEREMDDLMIMDGKMPKQ
jgi:inosine-uridine nucleoside N-ribohydrolase